MFVFSSWVKEKDRFGSIPLHWAVEKDFVEVVKKLIEAGSSNDLYLKDDRGDTPWQYAKPELQEYIDGKNLHEYFENDYVAVKNAPEYIGKKGVEDKFAALAIVLNERFKLRTSYSDTVAPHKEVKSEKGIKKTRLKTA